MQPSIAILFFLPMALAVESPWGVKGTCKNKLCNYDTTKFAPQTNCPQEWHYADPYGNDGRTWCDVQDSKSLWEHVLTLHCYTSSCEIRVFGDYKAQSSRVMSRDSCLYPFRQLLTPKLHSGLYLSNVVRAQALIEGFHIAAGAASCIANSIQYLTTIMLIV